MKILSKRAWLLVCMFCLFLSTSVYAAYIDFIDFDQDGSVDFNLSTTNFNSSNDYTFQIVDTSGTAVYTESLGAFSSISDVSLTVDPGYYDIQIVDSTGTTYSFANGDAIAFTVLGGHSLVVSWPSQLFYAGLASASDKFAIVTSAVPLPSSMLLLSSILAVSGVLTRIRKK